MVNTSLVSGSFLFLATHVKMESFVIGVALALYCECRGKNRSGSGKKFVSISSKITFLKSPAPFFNVHQQTVDTWSAGGYAHRDEIHGDRSTCLAAF